ncbi:MAG: hypothetical protein GVY18_00515 [Bacteroidetes bacterium]|jgi:tetratricopeptide (TPR) repeat protein|nr:hypothetical protein [Bacteroidota bacterium]
MSKKSPDDSSVPPMGRRSMEKMMRDLTKLLEQQEFETIDEANAFLQQFTGQPIPEMPGSDDPLAQAQELIYDAYEAPSRKKAIALARQALEVSPDCADAYVLLAEAEAETLEAARDYFEQGVAAGERALDADLFDEAAGHFWGILETRPYMRARRGMAEVLWAMGEDDAAIAHYQELLRLNPGDNQGNRYALAHCLLATERDEALDALLDRYEDDAAATWHYTRALLRFRQEGSGPTADAALAAAIEQNPHVPAFLLGKKKMPKQPPAYVGFGDENEAVDYVLANIDVWRNTYGALRWLRAQYPGLRKP